MSRKTLALLLFAILHLAGALLSVSGERAAVAEPSLTASGRDEDESALAVAASAWRERTELSQPDWQRPRPSLPILGAVAPRARH